MKYILHKIYPQKRTLGIGDLYIGEKKIYLPRVVFNKG
jgi:hypothetical protein